MLYLTYNNLQLFFYLSKYIQFLAEIFKHNAIRNS